MCDHHWAYIGSIYMAICVTLVMYVWCFRCITCLEHKCYVCISTHVLWWRLYNWVLHMYYKCIKIYVIYLNQHTCNTHVAHLPIYMMDNCSLHWIYTGPRLVLALQRYGLSANCMSYSRQKIGIWTHPHPPPHPIVG